MNTHTWRGEDVLQRREGFSCFCEWRTYRGGDLRHLVCPRVSGDCTQCIYSPLGDLQISDFNYICKFGGWLRPRSTPSRVTCCHRGAGRPAGGSEAEEEEEGGISRDGAPRVKTCEDRTWKLNCVGAKPKLRRCRASFLLVVFKRQLLRQSLEADK